MRNDYLLLRREALLVAKRALEDALVYAIFGLVAQVLMAAYYVVIYPIARYVSGYVFIPGQFSMPYLTDPLALSGSICLFVTR
ncbi:hypothetical protein AAVH_26543 [Aphelenchoides avenae]|nr:hypothetical protein AAVH_26543 [Aphelenchus avenae]